MEAPILVNVFIELVVCVPTPSGLLTATPRVYMALKQPRSATATRCHCAAVLGRSPSFLPSFLCIVLYCTYCVTETGPPDEAEEVHGAMADVLLQARRRSLDPLREEVPRRDTQAQGELADGA